MPYQPTPFPVLFAALALMAASPGVAQEDEAVLVFDRSTPALEALSERLSKAHEGEQIYTDSPDETFEVICDASRSGRAVVIVASEPLNYDVLRNCDVPAIEDATRIDLGRSEMALHPELAERIGQEQLVIELLPGEMALDEAEVFDSTLEALFDERLELPNICMMCGCCTGPSAR